jgi:hypothetical protein
VANLARHALLQETLARYVACLAEWLHMAGLSGVSIVFDPHLHVLPFWLCIHLNRQKGPNNSKLYNPAFCSNSN